MLAYHNDPSIKDKYVNRMKAHMKADALIQGTGWDGHKGCAVGCTFEHYDHARGPIEIGVPETLMWLEDCIFEGLPSEQAKAFPLAFLEAIPVGADLSMIWPRFALWVLADPHHGAMRTCDDDTRPAVKDVADLYRRWIEGEQPTAEEFEAAARAARGSAEAAAWAAEAAAWAAARAAARAEAWAAWAEAWAARAAAEAAEAAAEASAAAAWAARAAAEAAAAAAEASAAAAWAAEEAREEFWIAARDALLRLLREAPVAEEAKL